VAEGSELQPRDLTILAGSTWSRGWAVTVDGEALPDTWVVRAQARTAPGGDLLADWSSTPTDEQLTAGNTGGVVTLGVPAEASAAWGWTTGCYDVFVSAPDGSVRLKIAAGRIIVVPEVTEVGTDTDDG